MNYDHATDRELEQYLDLCADIYDKKCKDGTCKFCEMNAEDAVKIVNEQEYRKTVAA
jgi:hypothetical protein